MAKTYATGTTTSEGIIPHLRVGALLVPVKVIPLDDTRKAPAPVRIRGRLVYAMPGGRDYIPDPPCGANPVNNNANKHAGAAPPSNDPGAAGAPLPPSQGDGGAGVSFIRSW